jgi:hypothetical protein
LRAVGETSVVLVADDGRVLEFEKVGIAEVHLAQSGPPAPAPAPAPAARPAPTAPASRPPPGVAPSPDPEWRRKYNGANATWIAGIATAGVGLISMGLGGYFFWVASLEDVDSLEEEFGPDDPFVQDSKETAARYQRIGRGFVIPGAVLTGAGTVLIVAGLARRKRLRKIAPGIAWAPGGATFSLSGRF